MKSPLRIGAHLLARDVVSGKFAQSVLVGVEADFFKSKRRPRASK